MNNKKKFKFTVVHAILILPNIWCVSAVNNLMLNCGSVELNSDPIKIKCHMSVIIININTI